jgi:DNA-binding PadR family transcriptional regulator
MDSAKGSLPGIGRNAGAASLILSSLAGGEKHGYALVKDIEEFADVHLSPGTLYEALARLEGQGLIKAIDSDDRRRPYRLTASGATVLANYLASQQRVVKVGQARLNQGWSFA